MFIHWELMCSTAKHYSVVSFDYGLEKASGSFFGYGMLGQEIA